MKKLLILLLLLSSTLHAEVTLHRLFGSGMVLQRETEVAIWGWSEPGEKVSITCSWNNTPIVLKADAKGDWSAKLITEKAGGPHTIDVEGSNRIRLNDVLFGEVWLTSGQSNMEMPLQPVGGPYRGIHNWEEEIANANYPNLRLFQIGSIKAKEKQKRIKTGVKKKFIRRVAESKWQRCSPETVKYFSAAAYFFARDLNEELDVPIGIIDASWGATYIQQWISAEYLKQVGPDAGKSSKKTPTLIYNGMIAPLMPFTLRGVIWNQGEGNSGAPENYERLMEALVADWRSGFQRNLSFYYVQLAPFNYKAPTNVALLREQQFNALSIENTAMAVTLDIGDLNDIHPKNKQEVGRRLALCALAKDYNKKVEFSGPLYRGMEIKGSEIHLKFDHVGSGLDVFGGGELKFFEIAGKDGVFIKGSAVIDGDEVLVSSPGIKNPVAVRYAFNNTATASLINKEGLPASSFRTDGQSPASEEDRPINVRVASYNVEFGRSTTPEQVGEMFKKYKLDIIGFDEVPDGDWTARVGKVIGMKYSYVGKISSANHKDKYKSILSRTPLEGTTEHELRVERRRCWNPASVVRAVTKINGVSIAFYSLHICSSRDREEIGHAYILAKEILPKEAPDRVIVVGDYNNNIGDAAMNAIEAAGMRPTWKDLKIDVSKEFTYNALTPKKNLGVIDHILYNTASGAKATDGAIIELEKPLSDHKPIWAEIAFPRKLKKVPLKSGDDDV